MPKPFTCITCCETSTAKHLLIDNSAVCHGCFRHLFELAITSESDYPAHWGAKPLQAPKHAHILGPDLLAKYQAKTIEYACPPHERVHCQRTDPPRRPDACGAFVGRQSQNTSCVKCAACAWHSCLCCGETFSSPVVGRDDGLQIAHACNARAVEEFEDRAFKGLKQGRDYQICPNEDCKRKIELAYGCNHIRCQCKMHFCFICGKEVRDGTGHWKSQGGCPRFGQPESARAIYDDLDRWNDNDIPDDVRAQGLQFGGFGMPGRLGNFGNAGHAFHANEDHDHRRAVELQMQFLNEIQEAADANWRIERARRERHQREQQRWLDEQQQRNQQLRDGWLSPEDLRQENNRANRQLFGMQPQPDVLVPDFRVLPANDRFDRHPPLFGMPPHFEKRGPELPRPPISGRGKQRRRREASRSPQRSPNRQDDDEERAGGGFRGIFDRAGDVAGNILFGLSPRKR